MRVGAAILSICVLFGHWSCIEPFDPEIEGEGETLVVEGQILEGKAGAEVRLSRSFAFSETAPMMVEDARVRITDDVGNEHELISGGEAGVYLSDTSQLEGVVGRSYQLSIVTPEGEQYESEWALMKKGIAVDELHADFEEPNNGIDSARGMQVYLSAFDPENETKFYRWEYEETWIFAVPLPAVGVWNSQTRMPDLYPPDEIPRICWQTVHSSQIFLGSTIGLSEDRMTNVPIRFISDQDNHLRIKYSILVKQYSISEETYVFYQQLKHTTETLGTLFDPIPGEVRGNIRNVNNSGESVLGWFSADGFGQDRIFISRSDLPNIPIPSGYAACAADTLANSLEMGGYIIGGGVYVEDLLDPFGNLIGYIGSRPYCTDCRFFGTTERPEFWE
ncbi:MAG: DUF4249 domain-containing protein [Bacteroidota bacterium]